VRQALRRRVEETLSVAVLVIGLIKQTE